MNRPQDFEAFLQELEREKEGDFLTQSPGGPEVAPPPAPAMGMGDLTRADRADTVPAIAKSVLARRAPQMQPQRQITYDAGVMPQGAEPGTNFDEDLKNARQKERDASRRALAFSAFDQIAKAGSGGLNATDNAYWKNVADLGEGNVADAKSRRENVSKEISDRLARRNAEKTDLEVSRYRSLQDPNTEQSAIARSIAKKRLAAAGFDPSVLDSASGADIHDSEHGITGMEGAATRRILAKSAEGSRTDAKNQAAIASLRSETKAGQNGKLYENLQNAQRGQDAVSQFASNPNGYKDYGTLMLALKTLQGDASVVREAELRQGVNATDTISKAENAIQRAVNGKSLQPEQRQQILEAFKILGGVAKDQYTRATRPIYSQAKSRNLPLHEIFDDPGMYESGAPGGGWSPADEGRLQALEAKAAAGKLRR
jgi:hypothetical protein